MATTQTQVAAAHATLARNLLSSVLALAFPENLATDALAQQEFLAQFPQLRAILTQHNVFDFVTEGKAFDKFLTRLFQLVDTAQGVDRAVKAAAFELLLIVVEQCPMETLETLAPKLTERILKMVKYIKDAPRVVSTASDVARVLVRHVELYSPEARRDLHDWISKLLLANIAVLNELNDAKEPLVAEQVELFRSVVGVFTELLEVSPSAVRSTLSKLEASVVALALYNSAITSDKQAALAAAQCLAVISNASDKSHQVWKQVVDKTVEMAHQLVDPVAGKRLVTATVPTGMKAWLRENEGASGAADLEALIVYQRMESLLQRLDVVVVILEESLKNRSISEREVQLVLADIIVLTRRIVTVRAHEIGKQSAISEDGNRLPASVVYGALPQIHTLGLRCLSASIARAGLCALRHASKIAKVLMLASENIHGESHAVLYETVGVCVRVLGASTLEKIGQPLLEHLVAQCKQDLLDDVKSKKSEADEAKPSAVEGKGKNGKGKKRKRQVGDLSQLSADANASGALFLSARNQRVLVGNVDAALAAIASCVAVYGSLLPADTRSLVSDVALLAVQQQTKRRAMRVAAAPREGLDSIALMLMSDAITADTNGAHATNLVKSVDYWSSSSCPSSLVQLLSLNVSEALVHPRGPPLSLNFDNVVQAHTAPAAVNLGYNGRVTSLPTSAVVPAAAAVRGQLDWEREEQQAVSEPEDEDAVTEKINKRAKTEDDEEEDAEMVDASAEEVAEEDDKEEDYDDERPVSRESAELVSADDDVEDEEEDAPAPAKTTATAANDSDDDEFPDIVDGDEEDDE